MKEQKIKVLPFVKEFADYFIRKAKKDLGIKSSYYKTATVEYSTPRKRVYVWFFPPSDERSALHITYYADGKRL